MKPAAIVGAGLNFVELPTVSRGIRKNWRGYRNV
jgi:hypothetical protein